MRPGEAAVIGGGNMGADIAQLFAAAGWTTHIVESGAARRKALRERFGDGARIHAALEGAPWQEITVVVECVPEQLEAKRALFARLEAIARPDAILASNSSAFPVSEIARGLATQERMAGLHFFFPAHLVPLVEVIRSERTRPGLPEELAELMRSLGKVPVQVRKDIPGFLANRLQHALAREAYAMIEQGIATPEDVDAAVRFGFGFRFIAAGPCLQKDHAGIDVHAAAAATMYPTLSNAAEPPAFLREMVARGETGMKAGKGFFAWDEASIAREKARYEARLRAGLKVIEADL